MPKSVVISPFDGRIIGTAAEGDAATLNTAISCAADAFPAWSRTAPSERAQLLARIAARIRADRAELAQLLVDEIGKPITLAEGEVDRMAVTFELARQAAERLTAVPIDLSPDARAADYRCRVSRRPIGVVLGIVPYNWPFNLSAHKLAPALAIGNTIVIKPSPRALLSTYRLGRILHEEGVPPGVVNVVEAPNAAVQKACQDPRVAMVSFTGSAAVGWPLKASLPPRTKCTLELGGDAFAIVEPDADLDWAIPRMAQGAFNYAGQICISLQHVLAHESIYADVRERLMEATRQFPTGDPSDRGVLCGPMIHESAAKRVEESVTEALAAGAKALVKGSRRGTLLSPTLFESVPESVRLGSEEVFGPVLTLEPYGNRSEAIARVNRSAYGLQAGVFSGFGSAEEWNGLDVGTIVFNDSPVIRFDQYPYGGIKASGWGFEGLSVSLEEMSVPQVHLDRVRPQ